jgi:hypothetical protein
MVLATVMAIEAAVTMMVLIWRFMASVPAFSVVDGLIGSVGFELLHRL